VWIIGLLLAVYSWRDRIFVKNTAMAFVSSRKGTLLCGFFGILTLLASFSCHPDNSPANQAQELSARIDSLHETTMNKIAPLRRLQDSMRAKIAVAVAMQADTTVFSGALQQLQQGDTAMFGWMGRYDMDYKGKSDSDKVVYLQSQVNELQQIDQAVDQALQTAEGLLQ
jgi:hypothetical protein